MGNLISVYSFRMKNWVVYVLLGRITWPYGVIPLSGCKVGGIIGTIIVSSDPRILIFYSGVRSRGHAVLWYRSAVGDLGMRLVNLLFGGVW